VLETLLSKTEEMRQELEAVHRKIDSADLRMVKTRYFEAVQPNMTVAVVVRNHEGRIEECLGSILASTGVVPEILVVNDHSQDGSAAEIANFLSAHEDFPMASLSLNTKRGRAEARNAAFRLARTEFVLVLDAEHLLYPQALSKLKGVLEPSNAGFAYPMLQRFGATTGLANTLPWEPERLTRQSYIHVPALIRRSSWQAVGGYGVVVDECLGLQDYDFWLRLADQKRVGILVPEILARHRVPGFTGGPGGFAGEADGADGPGSRVGNDSMPSIAAALEIDAVKRHLKTKHEHLPWPQ
jgi:hypothetical protein